MFIMHGRRRYFDTKQSSATTSTFPLDFQQLISHLSTHYILASHKCHLSIPFYTTLCLFCIWAWPVIFQLANKFVALINDCDSTWLSRVSLRSSSQLPCLNFLNSRSNL